MTLPPDTPPQGPLAILLKGLGLVIGGTFMAIAVGVVLGLALVLLVWVWEGLL